MKIQTSNSADTSREISVRRAVRSADIASTDKQEQTVTGASSAVHVSSTAALASGPSDIDTTKVESIKAALKSGTYTIDSAAVADGMLNTARELLRAA
ncbi:flagellar biosynthesis anti-sigma factor FlgM [Caballeronia sp. LZ062]|uniref:flagellar biosynthesis anti-sigma factor FlgM n=1 Tax=unclassified Caballeronia TaxID=2646786 RepID=UPI002863FB7F|nr:MULTISPECIES: flagellar biosynthesis anti-sigma factor FlgM [unclassified Caballeronia]MDR5856035.1 flagellar biosynthesis anti-sigma factor FlgM [Caballeronia sp. LZ050]MDR5872706.1 flagellar biosynthesis anti-sigma factor FlgM [Caballeronia sp. LZ062]